MNVLSMVLCAKVVGVFVFRGCVQTLSCYVSRKVSSMPISFSAFTSPYCK